MTKNLDELTEFLSIASQKGFINDNTANARRTACVKLFGVLDEDQKNVEYVRENLDVVKTRFSNLNKDVTGSTVDEYGRRVRLVIEDYVAWSADRSGWEKSVAAKARPAGGDGEKKAKPKTEKPKAQSSDTNGSTHKDEKPDSRTVSFPIRPDFDLSVTLPRDGVTVPELKKLVYFLLPYAKDWEPTESPRSVFSMLEKND